MATNLLDSISSQLTPQMIQHVSARLGETPAQTRQAIDKAIPTLLASLIHFSSTNGSSQLLDLFNRANYGRLLNNLSGLLDEGNTTQNVMATGQEILSAVLADKLNAVSEIIATASGVTNTSASSLLCLAAPVVLGVLGRVCAVQGLDATQFAMLLMGQKEAIVKLAPAGLAEGLGVSGIMHLDAWPAGMAPAMMAHPVRAESTLKRWRWTVLGVLAAGAIYFLAGCDSGGTPSLMDQWMPTATSVAVSVTLPDGAVLSLKEDSLNYHVATFLGDAALKTVPKVFVFDRLHFDYSTAQLSTEAALTVDELSAILNAYPSTDVRLDGYTHGVGSAVDNKTLALDRVAAVKEILTKGGIGATRVTIAGYSQQYPLASNAAEERRAKNWRLELVVVKK